MSAHTAMKSPSIPPDEVQRLLELQSDNCNHDCFRCAGCICGKQRIQCECPVCPHTGLRFIHLRVEVWQLRVGDLILFDHDMMVVSAINRDHPVYHYITIHWLDDEDGDMVVEWNNTHSVTRLDYLREPF